MLGLRYCVLEGHISDSRTRLNRYSWGFSVGATPVTLVGGGNGVVDTIARGRTVVVAGRNSLSGRRFLAYQLQVPDTGVATGVSPLLAGFVLALTLGGLLALVAGLLPELRSRFMPVIFMGFASGASVLLLADTLMCRRLIRPGASHGPHDRSSAP
jgi:hypothetical protein